MSWSTISSSNDIFASDIDSTGKSRIVGIRSSSFQIGKSWNKKERAVEKFRYPFFLIILTAIYKIFK